VRICEKETRGIPPGFHEKYIRWSDANNAELGEPIHGCQFGMKKPAKVQVRFTGARCEIYVDIKIAAYLVGWGCEPKVGSLAMEEPKMNNMLKLMMPHALNKNNVDKGICKCLFFVFV
jgi:hypothetical protein